MKKLSVFGIVLMLCTVVFAKEKTSMPNTIVSIETNLGELQVMLYNETPLHRDNFIKLAESGYYEGLLFHRVIAKFMIQAGDPDSKTATAGQMLGQGGPEYTIPAEIRTSLIHKRGAIAGARLGNDVNPLRASSGSQFYIVDGSPVSAENLTRYEEQRIAMKKNEIFNAYITREDQAILRNRFIALEGKENTSEYQKLIEEVIVILGSQFDGLDSLRYTAPQRDIYINQGGAAHLDGEYTVFGELISGWDVLDAIALSKTDAMARPVEDIKILKVKVLKKK